MAREARARSGRRDGGVAWGRLALSSAGAGSLLAFALCTARHADSATGAVGTSVLEAAVLALLAAVAVVGALRRCARGSRAPSRRTSLPPPSRRARSRWRGSAFPPCSRPCRAPTRSMRRRLRRGPCSSRRSPGAAMGSGAALLAMAWAEVLSRLDAVVLVRAAAGAVAVAGAWCAGFPVVGVPPACAVRHRGAVQGGALFFASALLRRPRRTGSTTPLRGGFPAAGAPREPAVRPVGRRAPRRRDGRAPGARPVPHAVDPPGRRAVLREFIAGLTWDPVAAYEGEMRSSINDALSIAAGAAAAALALALCARAERLRVLGLLQARAVQQVALVVVLVVPALQQASVEGWALTAFEAASVGGFALLTAIALVGLVSAARCTGLPAGAVLGGLLAAIAAAMCAGMFAMDTVGHLRQDRVPGARGAVPRGDRRLGRPARRPRRGRVRRPRRRCRPPRAALGSRGAAGPRRTGGAFPARGRGPLLSGPRPRFCLHRRGAGHLGEHRAHPRPPRLPEGGRGVARGAARPRRRDGARRPRRVPCDR